MQHELRDIRHTSVPTDQLRSGLIMCTLRVQNAAYRRPTNETQYYNRSFLFLLRHSVVKQILLDIDAILLCLQIFYLFHPCEPFIFGDFSKAFSKVFAGIRGEPLIKSLYTPHRHFSDCFSGFWPRSFMLWVHK